MSGPKINSWTIRDSKSFAAILTFSQTYYLNQRLLIFLQHLQASILTGSKMCKWLMNTCL